MNLFKITLGVSLIVLGVIGVSLLTELIVSNVADTESVILLICCVINMVAGFKLLLGRWLE